LDAGKQGHSGWKTARTDGEIKPCGSTNDEDDTLSKSERMLGRGEEQQWVKNVTFP